LPHRAGRSATSVMERTPRHPSNGSQGHHGRAISRSELVIFVSCTGAPRRAATLRPPNTPACRARLLTLRPTAGRAPTGSRPLPAVRGISEKLSINAASASGTCDAPRWLMRIWDAARRAERRVIERLLGALGVPVGTSDPRPRGPARGASRRGDRGFLSLFSTSSSLQVADDGMRTWTSYAPPAGIT